MAASRAQIIANRLNALRSTGPKTDEGKARSRRNATTHGLSRLGVVPPEFMADAIADRRLEWRDSYQPADSTQEWFFGLLCAEAVRVDFCDARIVSARAELASRASESWDDDRALDASKLGARLSKQPEIIQQTLLQSRHGVLWLLDRWEEVAHQVRAIDGWTPELWQLAMDLLGLPLASRRNTGPWSLDDEDDGPDPGLALVREATDALRSRLTDTLNARDSRARLDAELGLSADEPTPLRLLHRYAADARRQVFRNLNELLRLQRLDPRTATAPVPPIPVASDGPPGPRPDRSKARPRARVEAPPESRLDAEVDAMVDSLLADFWGQRPTRARSAGSGSGTAAPYSPAAPPPTPCPTSTDRPNSPSGLLATSNPDRLASSPAPDGPRLPGSSPTPAPTPRSTPGTSPTSGSPTRSTPGVSTASGLVNERTDAPANPRQSSSAMSPAQVVAARFSSSDPSPKTSSDGGADRSTSTPTATSTSTSPTPSKAARSTGLVASLQAKLSADRPFANRRSRRAQACSSRRS